jgi:hypothetical protein
MKYPWLFGEVGMVNDPSLERERVYVRDYPTRDKLAADVRAMLRRGTRLLLVYVGGDTDYAYREQFFEMIGGTPSRDIDVDFYPDADHTFFLESDRKQVLERIGGWLTHNFATDARPAATAAKAVATSQPSEGAE